MSNEHTKRDGLMFESNGSVFSIVTILPIHMVSYIFDIMVIKGIGANLQDGGERLMMIWSQ